MKSMLRAPAHVGARVLTALGAVALVLLLTLSEVTLPLDDALFDAVASARHHEGDRQVVVVAIDPDSVTQLGAWPWPRRELAQLVDRLTAAGTRAVGLQLLLAQSSLYDAQGDALLAQAMARNGAVVLPVLPDLPGPPQPDTAILPSSELIAAAAALGHVDASTGQDHLARRMALHAGLGTPQWPAFALALKTLANGGKSGMEKHAASADGLNPAQPLQPPDTWVRADSVLLTYPGGGATVPHVSAADVLDGRVSVQALNGRIVIVGRTDTGPDQWLSLPGAPNSLPRVDFQANALARLLEDRAVWPMPVSAQVLLSIMLVSMPLLLLGLPGLRRLWTPMCAAMALVLLVSWALLLAGAWFPPLPALLVLAIGLMTGAISVWRLARQRALTDPATGVANRLCFDNQLDQFTRHALRRNEPLSLLLIEARSTASQAPGGSGELAAAMASGLKLRARAPQDLVARLDASRFAALLPQTGQHTAATLATALMVDLEGRPGHPGPATSGQVLRMGLASLQPEDTRGNDLLLRATRDLVAVRDPTAR